MTPNSFDQLTDLYEAIIDWPKRLANEAPFFQTLFARNNVKRLADVACGTGRHANLFHSWGLDVYGSDISSNMIQKAREQFGESERLHWTVQGFEYPIETGGSFDAVVCIGNSLALVPDATTVTQALRHMLHALRPGGLAIAHVLNLWKLPDGPCVWQKLIRQPLDQKGWLILKGVHRCECRGFVELVILDPANDGPLRSRSVEFVGLKSEDLEAIARESGSAEVNFFGNYQNQPYDRSNSPDLIMVATKGKTGS
jgi:SAM-dependent methyltransferase